MMPAKLDIRQWERLAKLADPVKLQRGLRRHVRVANQRVAVDFLGTVRRHIKGRRFEKNAQLTIEIKGSETPLADRGSSLFQAVSKREIDWRRIFVGVKKTEGFFDIAAALHEGAVIKVTPKMRMMFEVLWLVSIGAADPSVLRGRAEKLWARSKKWRPLQPGTTGIVIPKRPFIDQPLKDPKLALRARKHWERAYQLALDEQAR